MFSYNETQVSRYEPTKLAYHFILRPKNDLILTSGQNFEKSKSFDDIMHLIVDENIVTYEDFGCGITLCSGTPKKSGRSTENGITIPDPVKKPTAFPVPIKITVY